MDTYQPPVTPVMIIFAENWQDIVDEIGNNNRYTTSLFGMSPIILPLTPSSVRYWWTEPKQSDFLAHILLNELPSYSKNKVTRWVETDAYVRYVRRHITGKLEYVLGGGKGQSKKIGPEWFDYVGLVVIDHMFRPTTSDYTHRVFRTGGTEGGPFFPNADHYQSDKGALQPIWNTADNLRLEDHLKVLICQTSPRMSIEAERALMDQGFDTLGDLVREGLARIGALCGPSVLQEVMRVLKTYGLVENDNVKLIGTRRARDRALAAVLSA